MTIELFNQAQGYAIIEVMKAPKFLIPLLLTLDIALVLQVGAGYTLASEPASIVYPAPPAKVEVSAPDSIYVEPELPELVETSPSTSPTDDADLPQYTLANQPDIVMPKDPYVNQQWALSKINIFQLWQVTTVKADTVVAVLDTGIDSSHQDLSGLIIAEANFTDSPSPGDSYGHGTHVAGIIAAKNNDVGIVGVAPGCQLLNVKVADDAGRCQASALAKGIIWAVNNGASVINISLEIREPSPQLENAVNYAWSHGCIITAAAGNDGDQSPVYPAYYENCLAVAATNQDDNLATLSNYGDWVDVAAPGYDIYSTLPNNSYGYKTGTSFATAYVSGMAALLFNVVTDTNGDGKLNDEVRAAIETGCQEIGITGVGKGEIDAGKATAQLSHS
jgi:thermitase